MTKPVFINDILISTQYLTYRNKTMNPSCYKYDRVKGKENWSRSRYERPWRSLRKFSNNNNVMKDDVQKLKEPVKTDKTIN